MKLNINDIRELLAKKEMKIVTKEDKEKLENLKDVLSIDDVFFNIDIDTAVGILVFLGIPEDKIVDTYYSLISPENFITSSKPYIGLQ